MKHWDFQPEEERYTVQIAKAGKPVPGIQPERISSIEEDVMYWRKANHIHAWFVKNVQNGVDDCGTYEVDWDVLQELFFVCDEVKRKSKLVDGAVLVGKTWEPESSTWREQREPGKVIKNPSFAQKMLPTASGCFFGSEEYGEDYLDQVVETCDWAERMLADHKSGVPGCIYYSSSW